MPLTPEQEVHMLIGAFTVEIISLRSQVAQLKAQLAEKTDAPAQDAPVAE